MDIDGAREFLLGLPHVQESLQWGENLVFWVGPKQIGGKMFAIMDLEHQENAVIAFAAGAERAQVLLEQEGFRPAPYLARAHWVAADSWSALRGTEWRSELTAAHAHVLGRLPRRVREGLNTPAQGQAKTRKTRER